MIIFQSIISTYSGRILICIL